MVPQESIFLRVIFLLLSWGLEWILGCGYYGGSGELSGLWSQIYELVLLFLLIGVYLEHSTLSQVSGVALLEHE
jgi:hypothetical protein